MYGCLLASLCLPRILTLLWRTCIQIMFCLMLLLQAKAVGSAFLWRRLLQLQPSLHVFGHSHFAWDTHLQGEEWRVCTGAGKAASL